MDEVQRVIPLRDNPIGAVYSNCAFAHPKQIGGRACFTGLKVSLHGSRMIMTYIETLRC